MIVKQISSLEKIRLDDTLNYEELTESKVIKGERFSYQIAVCSDSWALLGIDVESKLKDYIKVYIVENAQMDYPVQDEATRHTDDDYITKKPGLMPDILLPAEDKNSMLKLVSGSTRCIWIRVDIPKDCPAGEYDIKVNLKSVVADGLGNAVRSVEEGFDKTKTMKLTVINAVMPKQELIYSQWFHTDCIADAHNAEIFSDNHWALIDNYMKVAAELGINMMLMPVITPPLDTIPGGYRPCVQLVDIKKEGDTYSFNFDRVKKWIAVCRKNGIKYHEMSHLFSQWGSEYTPNIMVNINGKKEYFFRHGIPCDSPEYVNFLGQFIPALIDILEEEGIKEYTYFHISDEPSEKNYQNYERANSILRPLIGDIKTCDALSVYEFYENGLVDCPITTIDHIEPFLEHNIPNQWAYYCCSQANLVGNRFLAMPSHRNRILGVQMYKYGIKGFLQWGYNFYNSELSVYKIDPYKTTSGDLSFPSGDAFSVYPGKDGAILSLRALVFYEALQDISVCKLLEKYIGKDKVIGLIDSEAGMDITFKEYPRNSRYLPELRQKLMCELEKYTNNYLSQNF